MAEQTTAVAETRPLNILIVDDSATMRMVIRRVVDLTEVPIGTIYEANNGLEAITILETCTVHAVFTDINMPVMNGHQLLLEIAQREKWNDILRIVISETSKCVARSLMDALPCSLIFRSNSLCRSIGEV